MFDLKFKRKINKFIEEVQRVVVDEFYNVYEWVIGMFYCRKGEFFEDFD